MAGELVTLCSYRDLPEALLAQGKLQAQGIECFLADENIVRMDWYWSNLIGGVKLQVAAEDRDAAQAVLHEDIPVGFTAEEVGEEYQQPACPKCGSLNIHFETVDKGIALTALYAVALPVPVPKNAWKCEECGARWINTEDEGAE
jgi:predicted nucleic-acid-binding Zn-ribbon protein